MLKHAIIRVNETTGVIEVLISYDLKLELLSAAYNTSSPVTRKQNVKAVGKAYDYVVNSIKNETMKLP